MRLTNEDKKQIKEWAKSVVSKKDNNKKQEDLVVELYAPECAGRDIL